MTKPRAFFLTRLWSIGSARSPRAKCSKRLTTTHAQGFARLSSIQGSDARLRNEQVIFSLDSLVCEKITAQDMHSTTPCSIAIIILHNCKRSVQPLPHCSTPRLLTPSQRAGYMGTSTTSVSPRGFLLHDMLPSTQQPMTRGAAPPWHHAGSHANCHP